MRSPIANLPIDDFCIAVEAVPTEMKMIVPIDGLPIEDLYLFSYILFVFCCK